MNLLFRHFVLSVSCVIALCATCTAEVRIKDITQIEGARGNQLTGIGIVTGLNGTGARALATQQMAVDLLKRFEANSKLARQSILDNVFTSRSVAMVTVTAELPPFARKGSSLDVVVSVLDDAQSLEGGTLIRTSLLGADGETYVVAQGPLSIGGFRVRSNAPGGQQNHPTVARAQKGGYVEKEALGQIDLGGVVRLLLRDADSATAKSVMLAINGQFPCTAKTIDAGTIQVRVPLDRRLDVTDFVSEIGQLTILPDAMARVVINERTGTVIVGHSVRISSVAIAHGNLVIKPNVTIATTPAADAQGGARPEPPPPEDEDAVESVRRKLNRPRELPGSDQPLILHKVEQTFTVSDLARVLNALGVSPRDLIAIFQALKESGAMHADLVVM